MFIIEELNFLIKLLDPPCCKHCKHNGLPCTSNLPISETRFKKRSSSAYAPESTPTLLAQPQPQPQSQSQSQPQPQPQSQPQLQPQPQSQPQPQRLPQPQPARQLSVPMDVPPPGVNISVPSVPPPPSGFPIRLPPMWVYIIFYLVLLTTPKWS